MLRPDKPDEIGPVSIRFGGGLNTRAVETDINPLECASGQNFDLDLTANLFKRRKPFDLIDTATNGEPIRGFAQLLDLDGTLTTLVQAGGTVYQWDAAGTFTSVGTVNSGSRLRGPVAQNWLLTEVAIITDLAKLTPVLTWDGTTLTEMSHGLGGDFFAKYCVVDNERALYANVTSGTATPHLLVGSEASDFTSLSITDRPDSALAVTAPWFLPVPDLRAINGIVSAFNIVILSTEGGRIYKLTGSNAQDFLVDPFYPNSGAAGDESLIFVGNDVIYGREGAIESLAASERFGDVETDDLSRQIANDIADIREWTLAYNRSTRKVYCFSPSNSDVWVFYKSLRDQEAQQRSQTEGSRPSVSPWSLWRTDHSLAFQPTVVQTILRPTDKKEVTYIGGNDGAIYQLEGDGGQDGGTDDLEVKRATGLITMPDEAAPMTKIHGVILYRRRVSATVTLTFQFSGTTQFDQEITVTLDAAENTVFYGGAAYYGGEFYYGTRFEGRLAQQIFSAAGRSSAFQVEVKIDGAVDAEINEIKLGFKTK